MGGKVWSKVLAPLVFLSWKPQVVFNKWDMQKYGDDKTGGFPYFAKTGSLKKARPMRGLNLFEGDPRPLFGFRGAQSTSPSSLSGARVCLYFFTRDKDSLCSLSLPLFGSFCFIFPFSFYSALSFFASTVISFYVCDLFLLCVSLLYFLSLSLSFAFSVLAFSLRFLRCYLSWSLSLSFSVFAFSVFLFLYFSLVCLCFLFRRVLCLLNLSLSLSVSLFVFIFFCLRFLYLVFLCLRFLFIFLLVFLFICLFLFFLFSPFISFSLIKNQSLLTGLSTHQTVQRVA